MSQIFLPGDYLPITSASSSKNAPKIGFGVIKKKSGELLAAQPGILHEKGNKIFIETFSKRYIPREGDKVIGVVTGKAGDIFKVDIGCADIAILNYMSFENATKRNRPNVKTGDLIYGLITISSKHAEPEVVFPKKHFDIRDCGVEVSYVIPEDNRAHSMGVLPQAGYLFRISLHLARRLLTQNSMLVLLGKEMKFQSAVGMNGNIWIHAYDLDVTMIIHDIILASERVYESEIPAFVKRMVREMRATFPNLQKPDPLKGKELVQKELPIVPKPVLSETEKKIKNTQKKLEDIKKLKEKRQEGETLEANQIAKIDKEEELVRELSLLQVGLGC